MAGYVDGFVLPIPKKNVADYRAIARKAGKIWREHGALDYKECVADDVKPGKLTSFPQSVEAEAGRDGVLLVHRVQVARAPRPREREGDEGPAPREMMDPSAMPFDAKRMIYGGFKVAVDV